MNLKDLIELDIEDLSSTGEGIGHSSEGAIFVEGALPQESILTKIVQKKERFGIGVVQKILKSSPYRTHPICPVFGICGGCQTMHMCYEEQVRFKRKRVIDAFQRIGKIQDAIVHECLPSMKSLFYRNKIQIPFTKDGGKIALGLYKKRSHEVIPIERCFIQEEAGEILFREIQSLIQTRPLTVYDEKTGRGEMRTLMIRTSSRGEHLVVLTTTKSPSKEAIKLAQEIKILKGVKGVFHELNRRRDNVLKGERLTLLEGENFLEESVLDLNIRLSPLSFFQVNFPQAIKLYEKIEELAMLDEGEHVVDAYSGIGILSLRLAKKGAHVVGIEVVREAVEDAQNNALRNGVHPRFIKGFVEEKLDEIGAFTTIFLNPPRKGCDFQVIDKIIQRRPKKIIYTSCDPATLARDLRYFKEGGYSQIEAFPFDMFPQTMHVETVVKIS